MDVEVGLKLFFNFSRLLSSRPKSFIGGELDETLGEATSKWKAVLDPFSEFPFACTLAEQ